MATKTKENPMRKHYVEFLSPGTFVSETSSRPVDSWDPAVAVKMAAEITERHGAKPYGFRFYTLLEAAPVPDGEGDLLQVQSKEVAKSGTYYIGGELIRYDDISKDDEERSILRSNMENHDAGIVCETRNGYRHAGIFGEGDFVCDHQGKVTARGDDPKHVAYRRKVNEQVEAETAAWLKARSE